MFVQPKRAKTPCTGKLSSELRLLGVRVSPQPLTLKSMETRNLKIVAALTLAVFGSACSSQPPEERSFKADLELRLGRQLSPTEVVEYKDAADLLCSMDEEILQQIWLDLDDDEFDFQTFVFTQECPERESLYREARLERNSTTTSSTTTTTPAQTSTTDATTTTS